MILSSSLKPEAFLLQLNKRFKPSSFSKRPFSSSHQISNDPADLISTPNQFYNRTSELKFLKRVIERPKKSTYILTGPPNCGKTRLMNQLFTTNPGIITKAHINLRATTLLCEQDFLNAIQNGLKVGLENQALAMKALQEARKGLSLSDLVNWGRKYSKVYISPAVFEAIKTLSGISEFGLAASLLEVFNKNAQAIVKDPQFTVESLNQVIEEFHNTVSSQLAEGNNSDFKPSFVIFIDEVNALNFLVKKDADPKNLLSSIFRNFIKNSKETNRCTVILGTTDSFFPYVMDEMPGIQKESYQVLSVGFLNEEETMNYLTEICKIEETTAKDLYETFGGDIMSLDDSIDYLKYYDLTKAGIERHLLECRQIAEASIYPSRYRNKHPNLITPEAKSVLNEIYAEIAEKG